MRMMFKSRPRFQSFSGCINAVCIPISFILFLYVTLLSNELQDIQYNSGSRLENYESNFEEPLENETRLNQLMSLQSEISDTIKVAPPLNNTVKAVDHILFITSIARTGQGLFRELLKKLKTKNGFIIISPPNLGEARDVEFVNDEKEKTVVRNTARIYNTSVVVDNFAFIDFESHGGKQPIQVTLVRDPVERAISVYYFARAPDMILRRHLLHPDRRLPDRLFLKMSVETCLQQSQGNAECVFAKDSPRQGHTVQYFCGHHPSCKLFGNEEALERAMANVENHFAVVGVAEELEKTVVVLEQYIPRFFKGITGAYNDLIRTNNLGSLYNRNRFRPTVDAEAKDRIRDQFSVETRFYEFLKDRLTKQYEKILQRQQIYQKFPK